MTTPPISPATPVSQPATASLHPFGATPSGEAVGAVELDNGRGIRARILTLGATLQSLSLPDREGRVADVVLGFDEGGRYATEGHYLGSTIGRYANRIAGGRFTLDGVEHHLPVNDGAHHLHGGPDGFHRRIWTVEEIGGGEAAFVRLSLVSVDGDAGYPGTLRAEATYALSADGLGITYRATTDRPTVVGMTNHAYFNLAGTDGGETVLGHRLTIAADAYLPVAPGAIPTGERRAVAGSAFDFREGALVGSRIREAGVEEQLLLGRGYDHNFILRDAGGSLRHIATVEHPGSGRVLELHGTAPGVQVYSGNFLDGTIIGKGGRVYRQSDGLCLEPQPFPDTPNRPDFPSARLDPGEVYEHRILWRFRTT
ncbi:aldose epimerase family protein [Sphingomonas sp. PR090111-T3T-6A]|uniref:aldose epimerase family protein n=1 Tax=Sphingomonas sp. PR090111-T3T-6A TaxID=685778 RepID=UPI00047827ED|nr:aldose epimerase family protein [Sphingomonas sp. PR090111-T3T-6A]